MGVFNAHFCLIKSLPAQAVVLFLCPIIFQLINHEAPVEAAGEMSCVPKKLKNAKKPSTVKPPINAPSTCHPPLYREILSIERCPFI